ncbi:unnamed protein product [Gordionus sp. m RMFG-2023]|uniref:cytosolic Fe-S cluster assembly factor narfl-like n=1 Tax=Gordionus sp. m RMFG-2023 TaxID=3053472 RepID=UPI0031FE1F1B
MVSKFAGIVRITDLDDYILPSQECIKPIIIEKNEVKIKTIKIKDGKYLQIDKKGKEKELEKAKITLNDCLACSGCVTSAETVLINQQSVEELFKIAEQNAHSILTNNFADYRPILISCSPQSLSSLAIHYDLTITETANALRSYFQKQYGVKYFLNTTFARNFSLLESAKEFLRVYKTKEANDDQDTIRNNNNNIIKCENCHDTPLKLPIITSICPGWVCYAEKSLGEIIIPHMSKVKSPQQIFGSLLKDLNLINSKNISGEHSTNWYHVSIMPCYDKKLEASRPDFTHSFNQDATNIRDNQEFMSHKDVDCVLSTIEVKELLDSQDINLKSLLAQIASPPNDKNDLTSDEPGNDLAHYLLSFDYTHQGGGSGGYAEFVIGYALKHKWGCETYETHYADDSKNSLVGTDSSDRHKYRVEIRTLKNKDMRELKLIDTSTGDILLNFAQAYGFQNIQNVVQKIKRSNKCPYHYIEIMACPSGCLNGGGQIRIEQTTNSRQDKLNLFNSVDAIYHSVPNVITDPYNQISSVRDILNSDLLAKQDSCGQKHMFLTEYHPVLKDALTASMIIKW